MAIKFGVSFYSYQAAYAAGKMTVEDCIKELSDLPGADGIEILTGRTVHPPVSYPYPTKEELDYWFSLMDKYGTKPIAFDSEIRGTEFMKYLTNPDRETYEKQSMELRRDIDFCAALGCTIMRAPNLFGIYSEVIEDNLGYAEDKNVCVCMEIHAPLKITGPFVQSYAEMIERKGTKFAGFVPDLAIFSKQLPSPLVDKSLRDGGEEDIIREIAEKFETHADMAEFAKDIESKTSNPASLALLNRATRIVWNEPEDLYLIAKDIKHVHGKFYHMDENCVEHGIDNENVYRILEDIGFDGYICSEFEGQRMYEADNMVDEVEQVRRHHIEMHRIFGY